MLELTPVLHLSLAALLNTGWLPHPP